MTEKLKPCPFCGGTAMYMTYKKSVYIRCRKCNSTSDDYKTTEEAENAWNKRENPWHTDTPTEEGLYLVQFNSKTGLFRKFGAFDLDELLFYMKNEGFVKYATVKVVAWQKIEPFEGKNK